MLTPAKMDDRFLFKVNKFYDKLNGKIFVKKKKDIFGKI